MGSIGTFGSFNIARLGIYASQAGLNVTGNNIANINTKGYTRQSLDQISLRTGGADRYTVSSTNGSGSGVLCTGVSQTRDLYLDIRYRSEAASVGATDTWLAGLNDIAAILDEVGMGDGDGIIEAQFSDFIATLENLSVYTGQEEFETQVRSSAQTLVQLFNNYASKLETVKENTIKDFEQDLKTVNELLANIQSLNSSIRKSEIHGDSALELRDERNLLIDQLSEYMDIDVVYSLEEVGVGQKVEKLTIKLGNANPDASVHSDETILVDGSYARQFSVSDDGNYTMTVSALTGTNGKPLYTTTSEVTEIAVGDLPAGIELGKSYSETDTNGVITTTIYKEIKETTTGADGNETTTVTGYKKVVLTQTPDTAVELDDNDLYGSLQSIRELLTECGEFASQDTIDNVDEDAAVKRGIPFYQKALDLLANKFAEVFNKANMQGTANGSGVLFSNRGDNNDSTGITAANISISAKWATGEVKIVNSFEEGAGNTANDNILHMIALMDENHTYNPKDVDGSAACTEFFTGSFQEMLSNIGGILGNDMNSTSTMLDAYYAAAVSLDASRDNVSSVDLNDEATNLMQYQSSYNAACRLMTTLDEVLDKLINGT